MAAISVPSREACLWTFSVYRADGHFVFCLFDFSQSVRECYIEKESTCLRHVSNVENVKEQLGNNSRLTGTGVCQYFLK